MVDLDHRQPLLVSGNRIAATIVSYSSGIEVTYFVDLATGRVVASTEPGPPGCKAIIGQGEFLLGRQGYGAFGMARYDATGEPIQKWPSHLMPLVDRHGDIRGPESENVLPSRSRFRGLGADGELRDGPPLAEYYTTYPALDHDGTAVFWRDKELVAVDADFNRRVIFTANDDRAVLSRVLLLDDGLVAFTVTDDLYLVRDTGLGPLETSVWPCDDGNLRGNPYG